MQSPTLDISDQNGFIQSIVVDPEQQNKKTAKYLLETAEQVFKQSNAKKIIAGQDFNHYFPGVPTNATNGTTHIHFYQKLGFKPWKQYQTFEKNIQ
ncbi:GNAT family N-acetyltransferase [Gracilibacillus salitolerans]|uniref:GNAT family N-acetyltransferase n=1 Tax=Gracilibacillus salitolerans TaxID=2663022 RepID=A0A5Q2TGA7_9BACI|nr:GNAT family N-acetyltransferase [Gracilibacillus salitolerans]QGH33645.1 GNAT family N-acetyltransferase [Gracilibacillus salitolerans]